MALPAGVDLRRNAGTGAVERLRGEDLSTACERNERFLESRDAGDHAEMAFAFLACHRQAFMLDDPANELTVARVNADDLGFHQVRMSQSHRGLRVLDAELIVHFDPDDRIYLVEGHYLPTPSDGMADPTLSEQDARRSLADDIEPGSEIGAGELVIPLPEVVPAARLAYRFEVGSGLTQRREILVDAETGRTLRDIPIVLNSR